jgi:protein involved in polysaccharide export with SLBB domain
MTVKDYMRQNFIQTMAKTSIASFMNPLSKIFFTALFALTFLSGISVLAQNIPEEAQNITPDQIASIKIDQLSDAQIRIFMERFAETGMSDDDLRAALELRGMPVAEIEKLFTRMQQIRLSGPTKADAGYDKARTRTEPEKRENAYLDYLTEDYETLIEEEISEKNKRIFGYKLFRTEYLTFEPPTNIPTPVDYQLGAGDEIIIDVWGASEFTYQEMISPDGYIKIPNVGPIYLTGLSMQDAQKRVFNKLSQIYSGLRGSNPNTFLQTSLGQVRTVSVTVIGEVLRPGNYSVSALATAFNALYLSGGPNENGTFREIEVIRNNKVHITIDVYDFLVEGIQKNNITLRDQDIIRVKPYQNRVEVVGEVKREGIYEAIETDDFNDLIRFTGGFTENAYREVIKVRRNNGSEKSFLDINSDERDNFTPKNGDYVFVEGILERFNNRVIIKGAVFREGEFELSEGLTVSELIDKAQGLRGDAFLERAVIVRTNPDFSTSVIPISVRKILKGAEEDITLKREDVVKISSIYDLREEFYVTIKGEVNSPGTFPYHANMSVEDLILLANGLRESATGSRVEVARRFAGSDEENTDITAEIFSFDIDKNLELNDNDASFDLKPFDQVFIRRAPNYQRQINIRVEGEARYPGIYALKKKDERISDLIKRAGGITDEGYPSGATLIRRTEFNPPKTDVRENLEKLSELRDRNEYWIDPDDQSATPEATYLQQKRLTDVDKTIEEMDETGEGTEIGSERINARRRQLQQLSERDTATFDMEEDIFEDEAYQFESIGIDLVQIMENPGSKYDLILMEGDVISVPRKLQTVKMRGEFLYPVTARFDDRLNFRDYVARAGGFTTEAKKSKSYVVYANGSVDRTKKILFFNNYPKVEPGAEVIVPKKVERNKLSATEIVAITSALATLALTINNLTR